jgi:hypothetical protein
MVGGLGFKSPFSALTNVGGVQAGPVADLRGSIGKMRKEKKSRTARQRGSHPYAMQLGKGPKP